MTQKNNKMKFEERFPYEKFILGLLVLVVLGMMVRPYLQAIDTTTDKICYETICTKYNLENFNSCEYLGSERVGFMTSEVFYLCDGIKVARRCVKHTEVVTNRSRISLGMRCEEK